MTPCEPVPCAPAPHTVAVKIGDYLGDISSLAQWPKPSVNHMFYVVTEYCIGSVLTKTAPAFPIVFF